METRNPPTLWQIFCHTGGPVHLPREAPRAVSVEEKKKQHLLALPRELRDMIYSYALISAPSINVTPDLRQPALLSVCRQIRREAIPIWYLSNTFRFVIIDFDAHFHRKFLLHAWRAILQNDPTNSPSLSVITKLSGKPHWRNLMQWCKWMHCHQAHGISRSGHRKTNVARAATSLAKAMRGMPWKRCEEALVGMRSAFGDIDKGWLED